MPTWLSSTFSEHAEVILCEGDCLQLLSQIPNGQVRLIVTSPPYNIGKKYEKRLLFKHYLQA
ncbi:MAG: hypothetical protein ACRD2B_02780 [Terriglobia bacterium]